ncbi:Rieske 2Fe-2S domain-containing protein [Streptomyces diastaticus]|uniref:Rieske-type oxygenase n=2 Tax=Streptomyces diastaticus TaxID=1956 RepID=A0ABQ1CR42_STRDI|nr:MULTISPECIES: Rieske 2Fe-2S domain-containing protein [Streptomyces]NEE30658.1 3-ketosteroid-9-alpha-hydroxylase subunit A [Streptomyces sp. SID7982]PJM81566.1 3-ketosteroid-9-alpha-hydroxylase [Streptomyces sp. TSRI0384-2]GFH72628.1 3-ketosteroid-9-alpha-hydroxylase oxygenase subunit [Streptomyces diastaticus subsp. diastaticus]GGU23663.1 3-ketosteroid-9-alpha-hydroxylase oxygenase subunit [Streptomyces diastaticus subsp. diastaticus]
MSAVESAHDDVRAIEAAAAPTRFARGWHCLGLAERYKDGKPHSVRAFGQKLVVFQAGDGTLNVLDAHCRHMGGDLSQGTVKGDQVACPFHDWRWGGDGRCKQIPYSKRVPLRARTAAWPTLDQDGMLFVWNDPEGNPPPPDVIIPRIEGATSEEWTDWHWYETVVDTNCREVVDNIVDMAHFFYVHHSFPTYFENVFEGHVATQHMRGTGRPDARPRTGRSETIGNDSVASYHGPSFMIDDLTYLYENGEDTKSVLINCHYPVDENRFVLQYGIIVKRSDSLTGEEATQLAAGMGQFIKLGFEQDIEIWKNKTRVDNPLLCEEDGPVYQLRRWYEQFYVDVADVTPEMTDRFEFELDTTRPVEAWQREVDANLARKAAAESRPV